MPGATAKKKTGAGQRSNSKVRESEFREAAIRIFHEHGYAAASVQKIADELGLLKGSIYYYMSGKEDLLYRLLSDVHDQLGEILERTQTLENVSPLERLHQYVAEQVEYEARHIPLIAIYYRDVDQLSKKHRDHIYAQRRAHQDFVRGLLREAQDAGLVPRDEDPAVLASLVFGSFIWAYRWYSPKGELDPTGLAQACARFAIRAVTNGSATTDELRALTST
jgi:AcrR family transcriptional regulator